MTFNLPRAHLALSERTGRIPALALLSWLVETAGVVLMAGLALLVLANATGRYFFASPLPWTEEVVSILLVWIAAIGVTLAAGRGALVGCEILTSRLRPRQARTLGRAISFVSALMMLIVAWYAWRYMGVFGRDTTPLLDIPKSWLSGGLLAAALGMAMAFLYRTIMPQDPDRLAREVTP
ncbi:TRAP transporter small permease [Ancylobacter radicis]|uniref:TRAP transporter small permease protein n=1 Tax=Ancylobacter radicis TaxID=2836179 RepID=A0ABS5R317_9HYPH|nr:TRAP transporter small permease subunit [Ancylobacter radicis]MBS9476040.1 TRAP transporter small permease subunit [Ancylobacter radicis]